MTNKPATDEISHIRDLLQEAKGLGGQNVVDHLDAAENALDRLEALSRPQPHERPYNIKWNDISTMPEGRKLLVMYKNELGPYGTVQFDTRFVEKSKLYESEATSDFSQPNPICWADLDEPEDVTVFWYWKEMFAKSKMYQHFSKVVGTYTWEDVLKFMKDHDLIREASDDSEEAAKRYLELTEGE